MTIASDTARTHSIETDVPVPMRDGVTLRADI